MAYRREPGRRHQYSTAPGRLALRTVSDTISEASTTTTITTLSPSPVTAGQPVTVTVTVARQFFAGGNELHCCTILGRYNSGTPNFNRSATSAATPLTYPPAPTVTSITRALASPAPTTRF